jgi:4-diphosphocytidyl-2C-methyl-D-erythritol kinase
LNVLLAVPEGRPANKTAAAYRLLQPDHFGDGACSREMEAVIRAGGRIRTGLLVNTFDSLMPDLYPDVVPLWAFWRSRGLTPHLAGSGPTSFLIAEDRDELEAIAADTQSRCGFTTVVTTTVGRMRAGGEG